MNRADWVAELYPDLLLMDGFDEAILGVGQQYGSPPAVVYSLEKMMAILMERDGMDWETAYEYFNFNIAQAFVGPHTPIILENENAN